MIKSLQFATVAKSRVDFDLLVRLLESLGLRRGKGGTRESDRWQEFLPLTFRLDFVPTGERGDEDLILVISDPDSASATIKNLGVEIIEDRSAVQPLEDYRTLRLRFPGGTRVLLLGHRPQITHQSLQAELDATGKRFAIVVSQFNSFITERLLQGTLDGLLRTGADMLRDVRIVRVPGAFEIPLAARQLAETRKYDAIICLGCLLRGDTSHYDVIVNEVTRGIGQSAQETGVPHAFGVLTCDTLEQAIDRAGLKMGNKGFEAALAAVEMASLKKAIQASPSARSRKHIPPSVRNLKRSDRSDKPAKTRRPAPSKSKRK